MNILRYLTIHSECVIIFLIQDRCLTAKSVTIIKREVRYMTEYEWRDEYNIGVESIDKEHRELFSIINKLLIMKQDGKNTEWICNEGIKFFKNHAATHFANEEAYMASVNYSNIEQHTALHKGFTEITLPALEKELERTKFSRQALDHFIGVCAGWLIGHTLTEDLAITGRQGTDRWQNRFSGDEQNGIKKVVTQEIFNVFHAEAHLVSDSYSAERFGSGIYYRLVYGTDNADEKIEIMLVFEEQMIIGTMGKILRIHTNELDTMLVHATRYSARHLVNSVIECFSSLSEYKLEEEDFLSYNDFYNIMNKGNQQLSLLFDTEVGYFAYCMTAPHLVETGVGIPIISNHASADVAAYLNGRKEQQEESKREKRKKVLVVDDSAVVRETVKKLLSEEYDVSTADSGVAAIRTIALDTPDLVLLDYEMPVCDGRQTLEMLRSDEVFANVPVIFLTGRKDTSSMISVMPLKPSGYILKTSTAAQIKQEISDFFAKQNEKK